MKIYAKDYKDVLADCEKALQSIQACVAHDGTKCAPSESDICLVNTALYSIAEFCMLRNIRLPE